MNIPQTMGIKSHQVILDKSSVLSLILCNDAVVIIVQAFGPMGGLPIPHVFLALLPDYLYRNFQTYRTIDTALSPVVLFGHSAKCDYFITKEMCSFSAGIARASLRSFLFDLTNGLTN